VYPFFLDVFGFQDFKHPGRIHRLTSQTQLSIISREITKNMDEARGRDYARLERGQKKGLPWVAKQFDKKKGGGNQ